jgi:asparagine synthase (glutamine-hydrolysing)
MTPSSSFPRLADRLEPAAFPVGCEVLYWDGRLDNRSDLRLQLRERLQGQSDDAALVRALFDSAGVKGLGRLVGDWNTVIRDVRSGALILASDFMGVRPLYYSSGPQQVRWSASLAALVHDGCPGLDDDYIAGFLTIGGYPGRTPYAGIRSVPPGCAVRICRQTEHVEPFWTLPAQGECRYGDPREYAEQLWSLFRDGVGARLDQAERVICELSGGLDSSAVVGMASALVRDGAARSTITTVSFVHPESIDTPFIDEVEGFAGVAGRHIPLHQAPLFAPGTVGALPHDGSPLQQAAGAAARSCGADTYLTGQGGDLLLGNWIDDSQQVARFLRSGRVMSAAAEAWRWSRAARVPVVQVLWRAQLAILASALRRPMAHGVHLNDESGLLTRTLRRMLPRGLALFSPDWQGASPERRPHFLGLTLARELRAMQAPEPLAGTGYTHPFFHRPLVEFLMRVPADVLCGPGQPRRLMRSALAPLWPPGVRRRRSKSLFSAPYLDALRSFACLLLADRTWQVVERGWVDAAALGARLERLSRGLGPHDGELRQILFLENWLRAGRASSLPAPAST